MARITISVCNECGERSLRTDRWLKLAAIDVRRMESNEGVLQSDIELDFCSPGCLLRYLSRSLEPAMSAHSLPSRETIRDEIGAEFKAA